jgi:hypothetical protein
MISSLAQQIINNVERWIDWNIFHTKKI